MIFIMWEFTLYVSEATICGLRLFKCRRRTESLKDTERSENYTLCYRDYSHLHQQIEAPLLLDDNTMSHCLRILPVLLFLIAVSLKSDAQLEEWCIADEQTPDEELQQALDWACGKGGADCSKIQANQPCFLPNTLKDHASYAFNNYFQKFKHKEATCYFNSAAIVTNLDPSHGECKYDYTP
ncbi:hypothetical protein Ancab_004773 [Ancistrocladus abbreviatus]